MRRIWKKFINILAENKVLKLNILKIKMQLKSKIQLIQEKIAQKHAFFEGLNNIMNKYTIEDGVFAFNGNVKEVCTGYFEVENEYNSLMSAINETDIQTQGIRVINNEKFQVGNIKKNISECSEERQIFDLETITIC